MSSVTTAVLGAVAEAEGVEPTDLEFLLGEYIDCEVIERLAKEETLSWTVSFEVPGHTVTVESTGTVLVDGEDLGYEF